MQHRSVPRAVATGFQPAQRHIPGITRSLPLAVLTCGFASLLLFSISFLGLDSTRATAALGSTRQPSVKTVEKTKFTGHSQNPSPSPSPSPTPTPSDIFLAGLSTDHGQLRVGQPVRITDWNGYNNQPAFLPDGRSLLYTSIRSDKQADIYKYDIKNRITTRVTETTESEFSPTLTPDGHFISVVRVEADGAQRLWKFPLGGGKPSLVLEKIKPVGYHTWIDQNTLALFVLGRPNTLQIVELTGERATIIADNIGRATRRIPAQNRLSFVHRISDQDWVIKTYDLGTRQISSLIKTLPGSEEYAWTPSGILLAAKDAKLFAWQPGVDTDWRQVADFASAGLKGITRIAINKDGQRLAIVAHRD